jgi:Protein of unknown function (DUF4235)
MAVAGRIGLKVVTAVIGIPVGIVTKKAVERAWLTARPDDPPRKPTEPGVNWLDALAWGALTAVGIVVAELVTRRAAEVTYHAITGSQPPPPKPENSRKTKKQTSAIAAAINKD